jgi:hypothetical protein
MGPVEQAESPRHVGTAPGTKTSKRTYRVKNRYGVAEISG